MDRLRIIRQRDFGVEVAPLLTLSLLTGAMLTLRLAADWSSPRGSLQQSFAPRSLHRKPEAAPWLVSYAGPGFGRARRRFPDAEFRVLSLPQNRVRTVRTARATPVEAARRGELKIEVTAGPPRSRVGPEVRPVSERVEAEFGVAEAHWSLPPTSMPARSCPPWISNTGDLPTVRWRLHNLAPLPTIAEPR